MKLKEHVTKEQLKELGFRKSHMPNEVIISLVDGTSFGSCDLIINRFDRSIKIFVNGIFINGLNEVLLKMFQLGYIEESEE